MAVIGASAEDGKIGNSVMKNLINGGYRGEIYPVHPKADEILGKKVYKSVLDIPGEVDLAVFAIPAKFCAAALDEVGRKGIPGAVMIPSGFAEVGEVELQDDLVAVARKHGVRIMGPNIYGFYYTPENLCATFCTAYDVRGKVALSSQSGGVGMSIIGFSRSTKMGVSAIVGLGNKSDLDEDDLLTYFEQDDNTQAIAMHCEDLKDGRAFAEVAKRVSKKKPVIVLKAGRTAYGAKAAASHTGALAGDDKIYDDVLRSAGVIRAPSLRSMLEYARGLQVLPTPQGENIVIITGAGGSGVLLSDACHDNGLDADAHAGRPRRRVPQVHPALRRGRQSGRHHRRRAADHLPEHHPPGPGGRSDPRPDPRLLAHHHHAAHGVREAAPRRWSRSAAARGSTSRSSPRWSATWRSSRRASICTSEGSSPIPTPPRSRSRCWGRSIAGRAPQGSCDGGVRGSGHRAAAAAPALPHRPMVWACSSLLSHRGSCQARASRIPGASASRATLVS